MLARTARAARHVRSISTSSAVRSVNAAGGNTASAAKHSTPAPDPEALHGKDLFLAVASVGALTAAGIYVWEARREKIDTKDDKYAENLEEIDGAYNGECLHNCSIGLRGSAAHMMDPAAELTTSCRFRSRLLGRQGRPPGQRRV